jgi:CDGSH-type Zn-finger protein
MKNKPFLVQLEKGKTYAWCQCNASSNQPFCDGSHLQSSKQNENLIANLQEINLISEESQLLLSTSNKKPIVFTAKKNTEVSLCGCKESNSAPYCSGAHTNI